MNNLHGVLYFMKISEHPPRLEIVVFMIYLRALSPREFSQRNRDVLPHPIDPRVIYKNRGETNCVPSCFSWETTTLQRDGLVFTLDIGTD